MTLFLLGYRFLCDDLSFSGPGRGIRHASAGSLVRDDRNDLIGKEVRRSAGGSGRGEVSKVSTPRSTGVEGLRHFVEIGGPATALPLVLALYFLLVDQDARSHAAT